jgi:hypothetical protein
MTTYFEHNAGSKEPFEPRRQDVVEWPGYVVSEKVLTREEWRQLYECHFCPETPKRGA